MDGNNEVVVVKTDPVQENPIGVEASGGQPVVPSDPDAKASPHKNSKEKQGTPKKGSKEVDKRSLTEKEKDKEKNKDTAAEKETQLDKDKEKEKEKEKEGEKKPSVQEELKYQAEKVQFVKNIIKGSKPVTHLMKMTGRFPLHRKTRVDGTNLYIPVLTKFHGLYFIFVSIVAFYILLLGTYNLMDLLLDFKFVESCKDERFYELILFDRNLVAFVVIWTALCHVTLGSVCIFFKRDAMAKYLSLWTEAIYTIHVDVAKDSLPYTLFYTVVFLLSVIILVFMSALRFSSLSIGEPSLMSVLLFRLYRPCMVVMGKTGKTFLRLSFIALQVCGGLAFFFIFIASKVLILLFLFKCRLLKIANATWNARFYAALLSPETSNFVRTKEARTTNELLFKDHCILLDLLEGTDNVFSNTIEAYFALQIVSVIFETYFVLRCMRFGTVHAIATQHHFYIRPYDWAPGVVILLVNTLILVMILKEAAEVGDEAKAGFEIIRRKTMIGSKSEEDLRFILTMFSSYTSYSEVAISGGGYFYFNHDLIIEFISIFLSYFIIIYQFQPILDFDYTMEGYTYHKMTMSVPERRLEIGTFLARFEGHTNETWFIYGP